jgi:hypothetical protein
MAGNVMSWKEALKKGYEPRLYPFSFGQVPIGEYNAVLDFKIWAKKIMGINCYFTQADTGIKFQLTVYCGGIGIYRIGNVNFANCLTGCSYKIHVLANEKKRMLFQSAIKL